MFLYFLEGLFSLNSSAGYQLKKQILTQPVFAFEDTGILRQFHKCKKFLLQNNVT
jgi:hypothetical protein